MDKPLEQLLAELPSRKLSRAADWKIRCRLELTAWRQARAAKRPAALFAWQNGWAITLVLLLVASLAGTSAYAYESPEVTRLHPLYPLKRGLENAETALKQAPGQKPAQHLKLSQRRLDEAERLIAVRDGTAVKKTLDEATNELERAKKDAAGIKDQEQRRRSLDSIKQTSAIQAERLEQAAGQTALEDDELTDGLAQNLYRLRQQGEQPENGNGRQDDDINEPDEAKTDKSEMKNQKPAADARRQSLEKTKQQIEKLKQSPVPGDDQKKARLLLNLERKLKKAEQSIESGDANRFDRIIEAAEALTATSESFISKKTEKSDDGDGKEKTEENDRTQIERHNDD